MTRETIMVDGKEMIVETNADLVRTELMRGVEFDLFCKYLAKEVQKFYKNPENVKAFKKWKREERKKKREERERLCTDSV